MSKIPKNPFKFGNPVEGDYYLDRHNLENSVSIFLENRINVILVGPRRFGKTSFVLELLKTLEKKGHKYLFVDIFNITSHKDFLHQLVRAMNQNKSWFNKILDVFKSIKPKIKSQINHPTSQTQYEFSLDFTHSETDVKELIQDFFENLNKMESGFTLAIDEIQKIAEINDSGWLEATIRTYMQKSKNISFLMTGSRKRIIYDMVNNSSRPLYKFGQLIDFPTFGDEFTSWIIDRFKIVEINISEEVVQYLRKKVLDTPNYVQMICFHLVSLGKNCISKKDVDSVLTTTVKQNAYAYQTILGSLTAPQQRALRLIANEEKSIYSKELLNRYEIKTGAALSSAIKALKEKNILDEESNGRGSAIFDDPLFALWLKDGFCN